jgi:hypothetical protein
MRGNPPLAQADIRWPCTPELQAALVETISCQRWRCRTRDAPGKSVVGDEGIVGESIRAVLAAGVRISMLAW